MSLLRLTLTLFFLSFSTVAQASDRVSFEFALYFAPKPTADVDALLGELVAKQPRLLSISDKSATPITLTPRWQAITDYALMPEESFQYFAIGLKPKDYAPMSKAEKVFVVSFSAAKEELLRANKEASQIMTVLAAQSGANIWDEETRQIYSLAAWKSARVESWQDLIPDITKHVTMHAYKDPALLRIISLGMRKFGAPDLVMTEVAAHHSRDAGNLVNATMQRLAEGAVPEQRRLKIKLTEIGHNGVRATQTDALNEKAKGEVVATFDLATRQDGDPANELWELDFPLITGKTRTERQLFAFSSFYGSTDKIAGVQKGDPEMEAASEKARKAFFKNEAKFRAGLGLNERLLIKAGFPYDDDGTNEYMWVEVTAWEKAAIVGILVNDPYHVKNLQSGSKVTVKLEKIYDYIFYRADGTDEGNETGKVLEKRSDR